MRKITPVKDAFKNAASVINTAADAYEKTLANISTDLKKEIRDQKLFDARTKFKQQTEDAVRAISVAKVAAADVRAKLQDTEFCLILASLEQEANTRDKIITQALPGLAVPSLLELAESAGAPVVLAARHELWGRRGAVPADPAVKDNLGPFDDIAMGRFGRADTLADLDKSEAVGVRAEMRHLEALARPGKNVSVDKLTRARELARLESAA